VTVSVTSFRQNFPAFADPGVYDAAPITMYIGLAVNCFQNAMRWDPNAIDYGTGLFVAHHLVLEARANQTADIGGIPGTVEGVRNNKSVDKVAVGYDVESATIKGAAFWNMTTYGVRFWQLTGLYGMGGAQIGTPFGADTSPQLFLGPL
jgi:hypothetical protein